MESNRLASTHEKRACKSIEKHIRWIDNEIKTLEKEIDGRIVGNAQWKETDRILQSIPGIGPQSLGTRNHFPENLSIRANQPRTRRV